ncbi:MAG: hypothetical protein GOMPHAMPRED_008323 [Gomphillus americanus]|uniref:Uncharacterized protein n=1 Tax=Gomphillus americanus TaxID=1940652 RepID=A0A8H3F0E5_9LECA|nr:MAG: hypothetical protein GOMPHAMPRED_008323 [Gomphillus americanus]
MAITRHATGNSRPRAFAAVSTEPTTKRRTATNKTTSGRVTKKSSATHRRKPTVGDKVKGAAKKAAGTLERKPGKKAAGTAKMRGHDGKNNRTAANKKGAAKRATTKKEVEIAA